MASRYNADPDAWLRRIAAWAGVRGPQKPVASARNVNQADALSDGAKEPIPPEERVAADKFYARFHEPLQRLLAAHPAWNLTLADLGMPTN